MIEGKKSNLKKHVESYKHKKNSSKIKNVHKIDMINDINNVMQRKNTMIADIRYALLVACHNLTFRSIDHIVEISKLAFNNFTLAKEIQLKRTKYTSIITARRLAREYGSASRVCVSTSVVISYFCNLK